MTQIVGIHPHAECFPLLSDEQLNVLAEDIRENGLLDPITVTEDGYLIDGRNRYRACELIGITPDTTLFEGTEAEVGPFVRSRNMRRHQSPGSLAMGMAESMAKDGLRKDGRWSRKSDMSNSGHIAGWRQRISEAGVVLDWAPELAPKVKDGSLPLNVAYVEACQARDRVDAEKRQKAIEANRKREATIKEQQDNDRKLTALTEAKSKFLAPIESGEMTIAVAYAAHQEDTRKQREEQAEIERGQRDTCTRIAECVRFLDGGEAYGRIFLDNFYPHEDKHLPEGMRLTRERIQSAIDFLTTIKTGVTQ